MGHAHDILEILRQHEEKRKELCEGSKTLIDKIASLIGELPLVRAKLYKQTPDVFQPGLPEHAPDIFDAALNAWVETADNIYHDGKNPLEFLRQTLDALVEWASFRHRCYISESELPEWEAKVAANQCMFIPEVLPNGIFNERKRRVDAACNAAVEAFFKAAKKDKPSALTVLQEKSETLSHLQRNLSGVFDVQSVRRDLTLS